MPVVVSKSPRHTIHYSSVKCETYRWPWSLPAILRLQQGEDSRLCTLDSIVYKNESYYKYASWCIKPDNPSIQASALSPEGSWEMTTKEASYQLFETPSFSATYHHPSSRGTILPLSHGGGRQLSSLILPLLYPEQLLPQEQCPSPSLLKVALTFIHPAPLSSW